jgi:hypothetical protein
MYFKALKARADRLPEEKRADKTATGHASSRKLFFFRRRQTLK